MIKVEDILNGSSLLVAVKDLKDAVTDLEQFTVKSVTEGRSDIVKEVELAQKVRQAMDRVTIVYLESISSGNQA